MLRDRNDALNVLAHYLESFTVEFTRFGDFRFQAHFITHFYRNFGINQIFRGF